VSHAGECPPPGWSKQELLALRTREFALADDAARQKLALGLLACTGSPDPVLRDQVMFEALATWLRAGQISAATRDAMLAQLLPQIQPDYPDPSGVQRPFAALALSELARVDRVAPYLDAAQRQVLLQAASTYLQTQRDYRGYDEQLGWRHGIAHGSDLLMQLALNPALNRAQLDQILAAVASQVAPSGHFYIYGEPERLARPVQYALARGIYSTAEWQAWLAQISSPAPLANWDQAFESQAGLAKRHNTRAFLLGLYAALRDSKDAKLAALAEPVHTALLAVP
jgi:hypothetical protein